jgi:PAS domain S-box-containing protein
VSHAGQYAQLFALNPIPMWVFDPDTLRFLDVNDAAVARYGWTRDEFLAMTLRDIRAPDAEPALPASLAAAPPASGPHRAGVHRHRTKAGAPVDVEVTGRAVEWDGRPARLAVAIDVAERGAGARDQLAEQLRQAQKMEAVGRLAGGVAHDFNNLLTAIQGNAEFVLPELAAGTQAREDVEEIRRAAERAAALTRQLLAFSRKQVLRPRLVELNDVVDGMERLLRRVIGAHVRVETRCEARPSLVFADPGQLEQVLMNLVLNARDAMPEGGTVVIRTENATVDALPVTAVRADAALHGVVLLRVADSGAGMDAATQARAFEPFFTTKPEGKGTGLGLATVHGIVEQSGGAVWLESEPGRGTTVSIALPARADPPAGAPDAPPPPPGARAAPLGTILLVEDEPAVRGLAERVLARAGYRVVTAGNGREALARWVEERGRAGGVDLIVTDVVMPDAGGRALVQRVREERADVPVLFVSGYVEGGLAASELGGRTAFLEKPFRQDELLERVRALLAR